MSFNVTLNATGSALIRTNYPGTPYKPGAAWIQTENLQSVGQMLTQFEALPDQYKQYPVLVAFLWVYTTTQNMVRIYPLRGSFNVDTVTYDTRPDVEYSSYEPYSGDATFVDADIYSWDDIQYFVKYGFQIGPYSSSYSNKAIYTAYSSDKKPKIVISFGDSKVKKIATNLRSSSYNVSYGTSNRVYWDHANFGGDAFQYPSVVSDTLYWKLETDANWTSVDVTGQSSYLMPAFSPAADTRVYWYISCTDSNGTTTDTSEQSYKAKAQEPAQIMPPPTLRSPIDKTVDASNKIRFTFLAPSPSGNLTSMEFEIQVSGAGTPTWTGSFGNTASYFELPADTLTAGNYQWRGRSYNADNVAGSWSSWANFTALAAPPEPFVLVTSDPKPTVTWEADGQEAYQVRIGDYDTGTMYGTETSFTSPAFLPDGEVLAEVRVINRYNLWSPWGSATATIENNPGSSFPVISAAVTNDAVLTWSAVTGAVKYHIYRNGEWIAETTETSYTDPWSVGENEYMIRAELADYNYADSAPVMLNITVECPIIKAVNSAEWIPLRYTTDPVSQSGMSQSQTVSFMVLSGSEYPVAEMSPHREQAVQINVAFRHGEEKIFEALLGRECFLKDQYGTAFRGVMASISSSRNRFYTVCTATLRRVAE